MVLANIGGEILQAFSFAFGMFWEVLWALILGFGLSGAVQALVSKNEMRRLMPDDSPRAFCEPLPHTLSSFLCVWQPSAPLK